MFVVLLATLNVVFSHDLISVAVIYRHGDRTPEKFYRTDPYNNASDWPEGFGQLTNLGKQQQYELGRWLRQRYDDFLPSLYSPSDVYVLSTDVDRALMSAAANLAGLYPPMGTQTWDPAIPWQPIPIHTIAIPDDNLLLMSKRCPKHEELKKQLMNSEHFVNISKETQEFFSALSEYSGSKIDSLHDVGDLYNTLSIETTHNLTLPDWTKQFYPEQLEPWASASLATDCYTDDLARLKVGPLFNRIMENFHGAVTKDDFYKFLVFSGHETTIANILNTMGNFEYHIPNYASTVIMELHHNTSSYVRMYYRNSGKVSNVRMRSCGIECSFEEFEAILEPVVITRKQWDVECQRERQSKEDLWYLVAVITVLGLLILVLSVSLVWMWQRKNSMKAVVSERKVNSPCTCC